MTHQKFPVIFTSLYQALTYHIKHVRRKNLPVSVAVPSCVCQIQPSLSSAAPTNNHITRVSVPLPQTSFPLLKKNTKHTVCKARPFPISISYST